MALKQSITQLERALELWLTDRRLWLTAALGLYLNLMLSTLAVRYPNPASDFTFQLLARLVLVIEVTLLVTAVVMAWEISRRWTPSLGVARPARVHLGLSGSLMLTLLALIQLLPLLYLHHYPALAEQSILVPVTLLQRVLVITLLTISVYNLLLMLLMQLRLPAALVIVSSTALYGWFSLNVSRLSHTQSRWHSLNDLFYWNQLWRHLPEFPNIATERAIHNIGQPLLGLTVAVLLLAAILTSLLWLPAAAKFDRRETLV